MVHRIQIALSMALMVAVTAVSSSWSFPAAADYPPPSSSSSSSIESSSSDSSWSSSDWSSSSSETSSSVESSSGSSESSSEWSSSSESSSSDSSSSDASSSSWSSSSIGCGCGCTTDLPEIDDPTLQAGTESLPAEDDIETPSDALAPPPPEEEEFVSFPPPEDAHPLAAHWMPGPPAFMTDRAALRPTATFATSEGALEFPIPYLRLRNRGVMVSRRQFMNGVCLRFQWQWVGGTAMGAYPEVLSIAFRTNGQLRNARSWEIQEGIVVKLYRDQIEVHRFQAGVAAGEVLGRRTGLSFPRGGYQSFTITENNDSIAIRYGLGIDDVLTINDLPARGMNNRVAIYNREPVAGYPQESHIARPGEGVDAMLRALPAP